MKTTKYPNLYNYYVENEFNLPGNDPHGYLKSIEEDTYNDELFGEIHYIFTEDEDYMKELSTGILRDMFLYYITHKK